MFCPALQEEEDIYDRVYDRWVLSRSATLEQQVAGLRLLHACLDCWLFQYPLTEESLLEKLSTWALDNNALDTAPLESGAPPASQDLLWAEAKQVYALGKCSFNCCWSEPAQSFVLLQLLGADSTSKLLNSASLTSL